MPKTLPSAVKEARGCYIKNPGRRPKGEPQTGKGLGSPPACLSVEEKKVWKKIAAEIASGVLQSPKRGGDECACSTRVKNGALTR